MSYRTEKDLLGKVEIPSDAYYGIHTKRAYDNFPKHKVVNHKLISAYGKVKLASAIVNHELGFFDDEKTKAITDACELLINGNLSEHIIVDSMQGGAGTSTNMNVNEVIANAALKSLGKELGDYDIVHPIGDINLHQSTNDTYPTALKIASIDAIRALEKDIVALTESCQAREKEFAHVVKIGRTQMQDAVFTTMGRTFSSYADAFARDRWRIYKCEERLRVTNLGGTAIGTGLTAPRQYIFKVTEKIKEISNIGLARSENMIDATQNCDEFVEVSGILKALANNLIKISNDLRFMSCTAIGEVDLKPMQAGSSIMPTKVNPVLLEASITAAIKSISNDNSITTAANMGNLELNAFLPLIADALLENIELLSNATKTLTECINTIKVNEKQCKELVHSSIAILTALVSKIGYEKAEEIGEFSRLTGTSIKELVKNLVSKEELNELLQPEFITRLGSK